VVHEETRDGWTISNDAARFDLARAHDRIAGESYWAFNIPIDVFSRAVEHGLIVGICAVDSEPGSHSETTRWSSRRFTTSTMNAG